MWLRDSDIRFSECQHSNMNCMYHMVQHCPKRLYLRKASNNTAYSIHSINISHFSTIGQNQRGLHFGESSFFSQHRGKRMGAADSFSTRTSILGKHGEELSRSISGSGENSCCLQNRVEGRLAFFHALVFRERRPDWQALGAYQP